LIVSTSSISGDEEDPWLRLCFDPAGEGLGSSPAVRVRVVVGGREAANHDDQLPGDEVLVIETELVG
jgi:hypothetical protein